MLVANSRRRRRQGLRAGLHGRRWGGATSSSAGRRPAGAYPARPARPYDVAFALASTTAAVAWGSGTRFAVLSHTFDVELDCLSYFFQQLLTGVCRSHAAGHVWDKGGVVVEGLFNYDGVFHGLCCHIHLIDYVRVPGRFKTFVL